jgi:hypothetical protein
MVSVKTYLIIPKTFHQNFSQSMVYEGIDAREPIKRQRVIKGPSQNREMAGILPKKSAMNSEYAESAQKQWKNA